MGYESYVEGHRRRQSELRVEREEARRQLVEEVRGLAGYFDRLPGLRRIHLFGSAAQPGRFRAGSDADLAFEGLPADQFCIVLSELVERLGRSVDAVRLEDASPVLRERILKGIVVYDRGPQSNGT